MTPRHAGGPAGGHGADVADGDGTGGHGAAIAGGGVLTAEPPAGPVSPTRVDPVARAASAVIGGPAGSRLASATGFWRAAPVLVLLAVALLAAGVLQKQHCRAEGWSTPDQFWHACYSDIAVLHAGNGLAGPDRPGLAEAASPSGIGQPPLAGSLMWAVSGLAGGTGSEAPRRFFDVSVLLLAGLLAVAVTAVVAAAGRRRWDAALLALSPILVTAGLIAYDLLAVCLAALSLLAWSRGRAVLGGVLLGLAVGAGPPLLVVGIAAVLLGASAGRVLPALRYTGSAALAYVALRVLLMPGDLGAFGEAWQRWRGEPPGYGSIWLIPQMLAAAKPSRDHWWWIFGGTGPIDPSLAGVLSLAALAGLVLLVSRLARPAARAAAVAGADGALRSGPQPVAGVPVRTLARAALVLLAGSLVFGTSLPVQASLVLLPLVALAGIAWRDALIWAGTELVYFVAVWLYIAGQSTPDRGLTAGLYLLIMLARLGGIAWLGIQAARALAAEPAGPVGTEPVGRQPVGDVAGSAPAR